MTGFYCLNTEGFVLQRSDGVDMELLSEQHQQQHHRSNTAAFHHHHPTAHPSLHPSSHPSLHHHPHPHASAAALAQVSSSPPIFLSEVSTIIRSLNGHFQSFNKSLE